MEEHKLKSRSLTADTLFGDRFIVVTEWANGEGFDIAVGDKHIQLTFQEIEAVMYLVMGFNVTEKNYQEETDD